MERNIIEPQEIKEASRKRILGVLGASTIAGGFAVLGGMMGSEAADCNPDLGDVCVPGVTAAPDVDPVPGNPEPGTEIPVSPTNPVKGEDSTTTSTSTTTTVAPSTTTTTVAPTTTSTTVVVTTAPPTLPPITVPIPVNPGHTN